SHPRSPRRLFELSDRSRGSIPRDVPVPNCAATVAGRALSIYFADATLASAFVARWCVGAKTETAGGISQGREDAPAPRVRAGLAHDTVSAGNWPVHRGAFAPTDGMVFG